MGGPVLLLVAYLVLLLLPMDPASSHAAAQELLAITVATLLGCRIAYHLHMRSADAYGGAYTDPAAYRKSRRRTWVMCVIYGVATGYLGHVGFELVR